MKGQFTFTTLNQYTKRMKTDTKKKFTRAVLPVQQVAYHSDLTVAEKSGGYNYISAGFDVPANLIALDTQLKSASDAAAAQAYTITAQATPEEGFAATYVLEKGGVQQGAKINIPKDMVVQSGSVVDIIFHAGLLYEGNIYDGTDVTTKIVGTSGMATPSDAGKYVKLVIANKTDSTLYIKATDLVDVYTAAQNATQVQLAINNNVISATIVAGSVGTTELANDAVTTAKITDANVTTAKIADKAVTNDKLSDDVNASLDKADSAVQGVKLAGAANALELDASKVATIPNAVATGTGETNGLMTAADKAKLDALATTYKPLQTAVADSDATTGTGSTTVVTSVTQNANGVVSVEKGAIPNVVASTSGTGGSAGLMTAAQAEKLAGVAEGAQVNVLEGVKVNNTALTIDSNKAVNLEVDGTYSSSNKIATASTVTNAINALDVPASGEGAITGMGADKTIATITETDGKVSATFQNIQIAENQVTNLTTDLAAKANKVTVGSEEGQATAGNFFSISSTGDLQDSGKKASDFATAAQGAKADSAVQSVTGDSGVTVSTSDHAVTVAAKVDGSTIEVDSTSKNIQVKDSGITTAKIADSNVTTAKIADSNVTAAKIANGAVGTAKLDVLTSFRIKDTATEGDYANQVYEITITNGVLTVSPVSSGS